jgi:large subunit ribosomal protein L10
MNKEQKAEAVEKLTDELKGADAIFAIDYRGISVPQAAELRSGLRDADASFRVVKNRLTLRAADAAGTDDIKEHLSGPTALTFVQGDVALAAKTLSKLGSEWELLEFKGGIMDGAALDKDSFLAIAKLPGRDQLNAQFAGIVASPITGLVRGLGSMVQGLALQLQAIADQGLVTGEAPAAPAEDSPDETPAEEAPAEDTPDETPAEETPAEDSPVEEAPAEEPPDDASEPDPEPTDSPEEEPSEEEAPEGGDAGLDEDSGGTGEGDADIGEDENPAEETAKETESSGGAPADPGSEAEESADDVKDSDETQKENE